MNERSNQQMERVKCQVNNEVDDQFGCKQLSKQMINFTSLLYYFDQC